MSLTATCQKLRDGQPCGQPAVVIPAIDLYAPGSDAPATMLMGLAHCLGCSAGVTVADLVDDAAWKNIAASFRAVRRAEPSRSSAVLRWHHVDGEIVRAWQQAVEATERRAAAVRRHTDN